eukprot:746213-Hanusia_phi.AAC.3
MSIYDEQLRFSWERRGGRERREGEGEEEDGRAEVHGASYVMQRSLGQHVARLNPPAVKQLGVSAERGGMEAEREEMIAALLQRAGGGGERGVVEEGNVGEIAQSLHGPAVEEEDGGAEVVVGAGNQGEGLEAEGTEEEVPPGRGLFREVEPVDPQLDPSPESLQQAVDLEVGEVAEDGEGGNEAGQLSVQLEEVVLPPGIAHDVIHDEEGAPAAPAALRHQQRGHLALPRPADVAEPLHAQLAVEPLLLGHVHHELVQLDPELEGVYGGFEHKLRLVTREEVEARIEQASAMQPRPAGPVEHEVGLPPEGVDSLVRLSAGVELVEPPGIVCSEVRVVGGLQARHVGGALLVQSLQLLPGHRLHLQPRTATGEDQSKTLPSPLARELRPGALKVGGVARRHEVDIEVEEEVGPGAVHRVPSEEIDGEEEDAGGVDGVGEEAGGEHLDLDVLAARGREGEEDIAHKRLHLHPLLLVDGVEHDG